MIPPSRAVSVVVMAMGALLLSAQLARADAELRVLLAEPVAGLGKQEATDLLDELRAEGLEARPVLVEAARRSLERRVGRSSPSPDTVGLSRRLDQMSRWLRVRAPSGSETELWARLSGDLRVARVERAPLAEITAVPGDSLFVNQTPYLAQVGLIPAWDRVRGEEGDVLIAIVDGGTEWRHPDLVENIWTNPGEIEDNGIDDDGNGFVDDVRGWNFADDSPDPTGLPSLSFNRSHGTHVAGLAAAESDNGIGISGASWNARILPINASHPDRDRIIAYGYEGVLYAAMMGADVINCSWARTGSAANPARASQFEREVVDLARALGSLVVAAAGNDGLQDFPAYPAFYPTTLAVAATQFSTPELWFRSNRDFWVDIAAPGLLMMSTVADGEYAPQGGTSMAAPVVSGIAALLLTQNPGWTPEVVRQQIRWTGQDLVPFNPGLEERMGGGMVQAEAALTSEVAGIHVAALEILDQDDDGLAEGGETLTFAFDLVNELRRAQNVLVRLVTDDPYLVPLEDTVRIPVLEEGQRIEVRRGLSAWLDHVVPLGHRPAVRLVVEVDGRQLGNVFYPELAPLSAPVSNDGIELSLTANGKVGFSDPTRPYELGGVGLRRPGQRSVHLGGGLLVGNGADRVSDAVQAARPADAFEDFRPIQGEGLHRVVAPGRSEVRSSFSDRGVSPRLGVGVEQRALALDRPEARDFVLQVTSVEAQLEELEGIRLGMLVDWELTGFGSDQDEILVDVGRRMLMVHSEQPPERLPAWAGLVVLEGGGRFVASWLHDVGPVDGEPYLYDASDVQQEMSDEALWTLMEGGPTEGNSPVGSYASVFSVGPVSLARGERTRLVVAWLLGESEEELVETAERARVAWESLEEGFAGDAPTAVRLLPTLPNPLVASGTVRFALPTSASARLQVYDSRGREVAKLLDATLPAGFHRVGWDGADRNGRRLANGVYHLRLSAGGRVDTRSVVLLGR